MLAMEQAPSMSERFRLLFMLDLDIWQKIFEAYQKMTISWKYTTPKPMSQNPKTPLLQYIQTPILFKKKEDILQYQTTG